MGSGESAATAGSNTSIIQRNSQVAVVSAMNKQKQSELEKPAQPMDDDDIGDGREDEDEEEDWMFKTFQKPKGGKPQNKDAQREDQG